MTNTLRRRDVSFDYPDGVPLIWTPATPDLALVANSISLMMPHLEPYVAKSIRAAAQGIADEDLQADAETFARQELSHHKAHQDFNAAVIERCEPLQRVDRMMRRVYTWMWRRWGARFGAAYSAGGEAFAYSAARWVERRLDLFRNADPAISSLFIWHLAEEVEHKRVAFDVYEAADGSRWRLLRGIASLLVVGAFFGLWAMFVQLWTTRRLFNPVAVVRLFAWTISFGFELLPLLAVAVTRGHHPDDLVDPSYYELWLDGHDRSGDSQPSWDPPGMV